MKTIALYILIFCVCFQISGKTGNPYKKYQEAKTETENIFSEVWCTSIFTDITFYGGKPVNGYGISIEPSITDYLSLNYKFALNYRGKDNFSVHGNPGSVVSPFMFSMINLADSNNGGWIVLGIVSLLIPEGVNFKYIPDGYSQLAFAAYINPIGVDYAKKRPELKRYLFMSGEIGAKAYFVVKKSFFLNAFGGIRTIYGFKNVGLSVGFQAGWVFGSSTNSTQERVYY